MKPFSKSVSESIMGVLGLLIIIGGWGFLFTGMSFFLLILIVVAYLIVPLTTAAIDFYTKRVEFNVINLFLLPFYYLFSSWHEILFIIMIVPGVAVSMIMGPFAVMLAFFGGSGLVIGLLQLISGDRMGMSDVTQMDYVIWFLSSFVVGSFLVYVRFVKDIDIGDRMSEGLDNMYEKALVFLAGKLFKDESAENKE